MIVHNKVHPLSDVSNLPKKMAIFIKTLDQVDGNKREKGNLRIFC